MWFFGDLIKIPHDFLQQVITINAHVLGKSKCNDYSKSNGYFKNIKYHNYLTMQKYVTKSRQSKGIKIWKLQKVGKSQDHMYKISEYNNMYIKYV